MMFKPLSFFIIVVLMTASSTSFAQNNLLKLKKNPFGQPDFLKYRPPEQIRVDEQQTQQQIPEFNLSGTFISINGSMAVVNDILLTIGEEIDGIRLMMVAEDAVTIGYAGKSYDIKIKQLPTSQTLNIRRNVVK